MSVEDALFQAVLENPHDDAPRLVYADWLEEQGDERGAFIRVQCELAAGVDDEQRASILRRREQTLLRQHGEAWGAALRGFGVIAFQRGFPARLYLPVSRFLRYADELFRVAPVTHLRLLDTRPHIDALAACPHLARLASLDLEYNRISAADAATLLASPHIAGLRELRLNENDLGPAGARALAQSPHLRQLRRLALSGNRLGAQGAKALAKWPQLEHLEALELAGNALTSAALGAIVNSPHTPPQIELTLHANDLREAGARRLAECGWAGSIASLNLFRCQLGDHGVGILAKAKTLVQLRSLDVGVNDIRPGGLARIVAAPWAGQLRRLYLSGNYFIMDEGVQTLVKSRTLTSLRHLALANCGITEDGVRALAEWPLLAGLRSLSLSGNRANDASALALARSPYVEQLESLKLYGFGGPGGAGRDALLARLGDRVELNRVAGLLT